MDVITIEEGVSTGLRAVKSDLPFIKFNFISGIGFVYNCVLLLFTLIFVGIIIFECKEYIKTVLLWVETQEQWIIYLLFAFLFTLVSFPFTWGYTFLVIASGYLFGVFRALTTVMITVNLGVVIAHFTIRAFNSKFTLSRYLENNEKIAAILMVISGPRAFKVAAFARLTPIPFGLQNLIFAVSSIHPKVYFVASFFGLIPAQVINIYLGSSLRSMEDVLSNRSTGAATGVVVFFQITIGISLMIYVLTKARQELRKTLNLTSYIELP